MGDSWHSVLVSRELGDATLELFLRKMAKPFALYLKGN